MKIHIIFEINFEISVGMNKILGPLGTYRKFFPVMVHEGTLFVWLLRLQILWRQR